MRGAAWTVVGMVVLALVATTAAGGCTTLDCWLAGVTIDLAPHTVARGALTATLSSLSCGAIAVASLDSALTYPPPRTSREPPSGLHVAAAGITVSCSGRWAYESSEPPHEHGHGSLVADVGGQTHVGADVVLLAPPPPAHALPRAAALRACAAGVDVTDLHFDGGLSGELLDLFVDFARKSIEKDAARAVCDALGVVVAVNFTAALDALAASIDACSAAAPQRPLVRAAGPRWANLLHSPLLGLVDYVLDDLIGADGHLGVDKLFRLLTNATGVLNVTEALENTLHIDPQWEVPLAVLGGGSVGVRLAPDSRVGGLDTWSSFDLLRPVAPHTLLSQLGIGDLSLVLGVGVNVSLDALAGEGSVLEAFELAATNVSLGLNISNELWIDQALLAPLAPQQLVVEGCLLDAVAAINITSVGLSRLTPVSPSGQVQLVNVSGSAGSAANALVAHLFELVLAEYAPYVPRMVGCLIENDVLAAANAAVAARLANVTEAKACTGGKDQVPLWNVVAVATGPASFAAVLVGVLLVVARCDPGVPGGAHLPLVYRSDVAPRWLRYGMVAALVMNASLFVTTNTAAGGSVWLYFTVGDDAFHLPSVYSFRLGSSIKSFWNGGVYSMAIMAAVFSGAGAYVKAGALLAAWVVPVRWFSVRWRGLLVFAINLLGKWSFVDCFTLVMFRVAFNFRVATPPSPSFDDDPGGSAMQVVIEPGWGWFGLTLGTMATLCLTHVILKAHLDAVVADVVPTAPLVLSVAAAERAPLVGGRPGGRKGGEAEAVMASAFVFDPPRPALSWVLRASVPVVLAGALGVAVWGMNVLSFAYEFFGLAGAVLETVGAPTSRPYSLLSLSHELPYAGPHPDAVGIRFVQAVFYVLAVAVPLATMVFLAALWVVPLSAAAQLRLYLWAECVNAWACLDVFMVAIVATLSQLHTYAAFIVGNRCDLINALVKEYLNGAVDGDDTCFDVRASLLDGCWLLFGSIVAVWVVSLAVLHMSRRAIVNRAREAAARPAFPRLQ